MIPMTGRQFSSSSSGSSTAKPSGLQDTFTAIFVPPIRLQIATSK